MEVKGVKESNIDWQNGIAWVRYDANVTSPEELVRAINSHTTFKASRLN